MKDYLNVALACSTKKHNPIHKTCNDLDSSNNQDLWAKSQDNPVLTIEVTLSMRDQKQTPSYTTCVQ